MNGELIPQNTSIEGFRHCVSVPIRFADLDVMGHVNNAVYLTYMEIGRVNYFRDLGIWEDRHIQMIAPIMAKSTVEYKLPLNLEDGTVEVYTRCRRLGYKSHTMEHQIICHRRGKAEVAALGEVVLVPYDYHVGLSIPVPDQWRELMREYEVIKPAEK